jgi:molybdopterin-synthase adenylyltransferase
VHSRQKLIFGEEGQKKIEQSRVAIIGMGALGTVAAELLVRSGVKNLIIVDRDVVEETNLQRQTLYSFNDLGRSKVIAAKERLVQINPQVKIEERAIHLSAKNISLNVDLVLDCTDNQQTRFLINDYCKKNNLYWIYAAAIKTSGYVMPILPDHPCLKCFMQEAQLDTCETAGVLNTITSSIATLQVQVALDLLTEKDVKPLLYHYNLSTKKFRSLIINKNPACRTCTQQFDYLEQKEESKFVKFCSSGRQQVNGKELDLVKVKERLEKIDVVTEDGNTLQFRNILLFADGRALIKAGSTEKALADYSKFIGN